MNTKIGIKVPIPISIYSFFIVFYDFFYFFFFYFLTSSKTFLAEERMPFLGTSQFLESRPLICELTNAESDLLCLALVSQRQYFSALIIQVGRGRPMAQTC